MVYLKELAISVGRGLSPRYLLVVREQQRTNATWCLVVHDYIWAVVKIMVPFWVPIL